MDNPLPNPARFLNRAALWFALSATPGAVAGQLAETQANEPLIRATEPSGSSTYYTVNKVVGADRFFLEGYAGKGVVLGNAEGGHIWGGTDPGAPANSEAGGHDYLRGQVTRYVGSPGFTPGFPVEYDYHATMVGHAMAGAGSLSGSARGIAPYAQLWSGAIATAFYTPRLSGSFEANDKSFNTVYHDFFNGANPGRKAADVVNSSWSDGNGATDGSSINARATDGLAFRNPLTTFVVAAGNSGPGANTVRDMAAGYNNIAVGALAGPSAKTPFKEAADFSSRGPSDFYNPVTGQTVVGARASVDISAPGEDLRLAAYLGPTGANSAALGGSNPFSPTPPFSSGYIFNASGTSFASPIVAGGVGLLKNVAYDLYGNNDSARDSRVMKSVLQASADHSMLGWSNGQHLDGGVIRTEQALDYTYGAGGLDLNRSFETFASYDTTADVPGTMSNGIISRHGWDFGSLTGADAANVFYFDTLLGGGPLSLALNWFADRTYAYSDATEEVSTEDLSLANLDLELWTVDTDGKLDSLYATSDSLYNNTEHLYFANLERGHYAIRVLLDGFVYGDAAEVEYGLSWAVPEASANVTVLGLGLLALMASRRYRRAA